MDKNFYICYLGEEIYILFLQELLFFDYLINGLSLFTYILSLLVHRETDFSLALY